MKLIILFTCVAGIITCIILAFKFADKEDELGFKSFISEPIQEDEFE